MTRTLEDYTEEYKNLMQAAFDEIAVRYMELAEEYFSDAAYVASQVKREYGSEASKKLLDMYSVNPMDFVM